jgi:hypothetical protein
MGAGAAYMQREIREILRLSVAIGSSYIGGLGQRICSLRSAVLLADLAACKALAKGASASASGTSLSLREGYGEPCDVTSLSLRLEKVV